MFVLVGLLVMLALILARLVATRRVTRTETAVAVAGVALVAVSNWLGDEWWFTAFLFGGSASVIAVFSMNRRPAR